MEMLATDYAGWGTLFPKAREPATNWLTAIGFDTQTKLLDMYALLGRADVVEDVAPSPGSRADAA